MSRGGQVNHTMLILTIFVSTIILQQCCGLPMTQQQPGDRDAAGYADDSGLSADIYEIAGGDGGLGVYVTRDAADGRKTCYQCEGGVCSRTTCCINVPLGIGLCTGTDADLPRRRNAARFIGNTPEAPRNEPRVARPAGIGPYYTLTTPAHVLVPSYYVGDGAYDGYIGRPPYLDASVAGYHSPYSTHYWGRIEAPYHGTQSYRSHTTTGSPFGYIGVYPGIGVTGAYPERPYQPMQRTPRPLLLRSTHSQERIVAQRGDDSFRAIPYYFGHPDFPGYIADDVRMMPREEVVFDDRPNEAGYIGRAPEVVDTLGYIGSALYATSGDRRPGYEPPVRDATQRSPRPLLRPIRTQQIMDHEYSDITGIRTGAKDQGYPPGILVDNGEKIFDRPQKGIGRPREVVDTSGYIGSNLYGSAASDRKHNRKSSSPEVYAPEIGYIGAPTDGAILLDVIRKDYAASGLTHGSRRSPRPLLKPRRPISDVSVEAFPDGPDANVENLPDETDVNVEELPNDDGPDVQVEVGLLHVGPTVNVQLLQVRPDANVEELHVGPDINVEELHVGADVDVEVLPDGRDVNVEVFPNGPEVNVEVEGLLPRLDENVEEISDVNVEELSDGPDGNVEELPDDGPDVNVEELPDDGPDVDVEELPDDGPDVNVEELPDGPNVNVEELPDDGPGVDVEELPDDGPGVDVEELPDDGPGVDVEELPDDGPGVDVEELPGDGPGVDVEELPDDGPGVEVDVEELPDDGPGVDVEELPDDGSGVNVEEIPDGPDVNVEVFPDGASSEDRGMGETT